MAVDRLKQCEQIVELARELGIHRRLLYRWRDQLDPAESENSPPPRECAGVHTAERGRSVKASVGG
jgi:transposase-like protein